jgi:3-oxoacyl-(acyl-carrier-protein) synthase
MSEPVFVAGIGIISAIGNNAAECFDALQNGRAGIGEMHYLDSVHRHKIPIAEVKLSNEELVQLSGLPAAKSRTALLSMVAAKEALNNAGIKNIATLRTGFISANSVGGMDKTENFFVPFRSNNKKGRLRDVVHHECGSITELVADQLGIKDYITTVSTACSSSANAIFLAQGL